MPASTPSTASAMAATAAGTTSSSTTRGKRKLSRGGGPKPKRPKVETVKGRWTEPENSLWQRLLVDAGSDSSGTPNWTKLETAWSAAVLADDSVRAKSNDQLKWRWNQQQKTQKERADRASGKLKKKKKAQGASEQRFWPGGGRTQQAGRFCLCKPTEP